MIGVKSLPLYLGDHPQWPLSVIATGMIAGLLGTGYAAGLSEVFYVGCVGHIAPAMYRQIWTADLKDSNNLWNKFKSNNGLGASITGWIAAGHFTFL
jgi:4-hydroxybenzoate polyprenyltransferase